MRSRVWLLPMLCALLTWLAAGTVAAARADVLPETRLRIVGGLARIEQFTHYEKPFWTTLIRERSGGRIVAEILPFDQSGIRAQDMLRLIGLGVVPFGTILLSTDTEHPELGGADLPLVSPDLPTLERVTRAYRPFLERIMRERFGLEVLAVYTYPAQVLYCRAAFAALDDLKGRRVRTSSVAQAELVEALGGIPVVLPFAEVTDAVRRNLVDCAITGTASGHTIGLHEVTTHIHEMAVSWGLSIFAANGQAWKALAHPVRRFLAEQVATLETDIWNAAGRQTAAGFACNTGADGCALESKGRMVRVPLSDRDAARVRVLISRTVLPAWIRRCGPTCAEAWDASIGPLLSIPAPQD